MGQVVPWDAAAEGGETSGIANFRFEISEKGKGKGKLKYRFKDKTTSKTNQHKMNCPSGIIGGEAKSIEASMKAKGRVTLHPGLVARVAYLTGMMLLVHTMPNKLTFGEDKRQPFSEGAYSRISNTGSGGPKEVKLDEWRLYPMADGNYSLEIEQADFRGRGRIVEHRILSSDLRPIAFDIKVVSRSQPEDIQLRISCQFTSVQVHCNADDAVGKLSATDTIQQKMPYGFLPVMGPFPADLAWTSQMYLAQMDHADGGKVLVPVVGFGEGKSRDGLKLVAEDGDEVEYMGREKMNLLNQEIEAHKFRLMSTSSPNDPEGLRFAWLSESGLLIQLANKNGPFLVLSAYHGPPL